ncbi:MAG: class I SAM-dependent methyltransferase [Acidobacteria bacterium]|nr:class I SAM-dependent methyltransferase [Acidobacteriota bacterium]
MIRLRHILHPVHAARSAARRLDDWIFKYRARRKFRDLRRGHRERCWCGGELSEFRWHASYGVCAECGCYVNRRPPLPEELKRIYSFDLYWHTRQRLKGFPAIEQRPSNDRADGRVDFWLELIERFAPPRGRAIEIGAAHGVLLGELRKRGYECIGVEPDEETAAFVRGNTGLEIRAGLFPDVALPPCDLFLAFDVIEHSPDPVRFLQGAARLLAPGGVAILQSPIDRYGTEPPFGERFRDAFDDVEHLQLFTDRAMEEMARRAGLTIVSANERLWLHHEIVVFKKPQA